MLAVDRVPLGAPGIYRAFDTPLRALTGERMDVCAFVGVAPRGPARIPVFAAPWAPGPAREGSSVTQSLAVAVESWDEYVRLYGSFEGPGLLPYAVASFFENGGTRVYVVRVVHDYRLPNGNADVGRNGAGVASAPLVGLAAQGGRPVCVRARNEGTWGNALRATLRFDVRALALAPNAFTTTEITCPLGTEAGAGTTLRLELAPGVLVLRSVTLAREVWPSGGARELRLTLDAPVPSVPRAAEVVEAALDVFDGRHRRETLTRLGLSSIHPRFVARVLVEESQLLFPAPSPSDPTLDWLTADLVPDITLPPYETDEFSGGADRYEDIVPDDFFDTGWVLGDDAPGCGVHALTQLGDLSLLVVPDLYSPRRLDPIEPVADVSGAGPAFADCDPPGVDPQQTRPVGLDGLALDPGADLATIIALQQRLVELADVLESFIVLLDVPPGLSQRQILRWRATFGTAYAAAYHPWVRVARSDDTRSGLVRANPSAIAAGIIARREHALGVQAGPANELAAGVVDVDDRLDPARLDELHPAAVNTFVRERDGVRLTAARTMSLVADYRQLSVRRLVTMLRRVLERQLQWTVFEPNDDRLRRSVRNQLEAYLRQLFLANAFAGARPEDAFFVRCDDSLNPSESVDRGRLVVEIGVAPVEPIEFIVVQFARDGDGTVRVRE